MLVKYYSLEQLKNKNISEQTDIKSLGEAKKQAEISWDKLKDMDSQTAFDFFKKEMKLPDSIKSCRFLSDNNVMFVVRKQKKMKELGEDLKVLAILEGRKAGG